MQPSGLGISDVLVLFAVVVSAGCVNGQDQPEAPPADGSMSDALPAALSAASLVDDEVVIDGRFAEWDDVPVLLDDPVDALAGAAVDLGTVHATADGRHVFFTIEVGRTVNAQAMPGTLAILLDVDDDTGTGETVETFPGIDLVVEFSRTDAADASGYGTGMAVRELGASGVLEDRVNASRRDLVVAPTSSATRFEVRISRAPDGGTGRSDLAGPSARAGFIYTAEGAVVDRTESAAFGLPPLDTTAPSGWDGALDRTGDVRVLAWNVSSESFRDRPERFARLMAAADPDVLLLDEVYGSVTDADLRAFLSRPEMARRGRWEFVLGTSGGRQKTVVASRIGVRPEPGLVRLPYPDGTLNALSERFPAFRPVADRERDNGLASVGAWVDVAGRPVLFVPIDFQSAGYHGSVQDELRILQARTLRNAVADAVGTEGAALVIGGDLNLVGSPAPLDTLVRGLDGGSDLVAVDTYRLTDRSMSTWRNDNLPFTPGRLDFVLISGSTLSTRQAFAFDAEELSDDLRERLGVERDDSRLTSDHLPLVVDLSLREEH